MDTIEKLNTVIEYSEQHLEEKLDIDAISRLVCLSEYDLQRMFSFIAEMSFSDYIRKRRLTLAGIELKYANSKVIDVAMKYGYDSPVSFARAFQSFHGITPSEAKKSEIPLKIFPRLVFQISVKEVMSMIKSETMTVNGKSYEASYFGEADMSAWSDIYSKRKYWRLENTGDDFKDCFKKYHVLPYNNYPPMDIQLDQVFVIDYYHKNSDKVTRKYYIADGKVWNGMESTTEIAINTDPLKLEMISVNGYEYTAEYYGEQYIGDWSDTYIKREFWKLRNAYEDFENLPQTNDVLPYNNFPPMDIKLRQVFVIDYHPKAGVTIERKYYISDGCIWNDMECTAEVIIP